MKVITQNTTNTAGRTPVLLLSVIVIACFSSCNSKRKDDAAEEKQLQFIFKQNGFRYPVFIDKENKIGKLNNFPSKSEYQCFLLDKDNSVLLVGNPSYNPGIWALFKKVILTRENK